MNARTITGFSMAALLGIGGAAIAQEGGKMGAPSPAPGNPSTTQMEPNSPGGVDKASPSRSSEKGSKSEQPSMKGAQKAPSSNGERRAQSRDEGKPPRNSTAEKKSSGASLENRVSKESKKSSSGAATGEQGKSNTAEQTGNKTSVSLSQEQRTKVESAFKGHASAKVDVRIDARAGVTVPRDVTLVAIPEDVIVIVPEWRRYRYIVIGDEICIVDPDTFIIVDVIAAV